MTTVAIFPIPHHQGEVSYQAVAGAQQSEGRTAGEALDALTAQLPEGSAGTLVVVQHGPAGAGEARDEHLPLSSQPGRRLTGEIGVGLPAKALSP